MPIVIFILHWQEWRSGNDICEQRSSKGPAICHCLQHDAAAASGLARNGDTGTIAAERSNVLSHPLKGEVLVEQSGIDIAKSVDFITREEPKGSEPVLNDDADEAVMVDGRDIADILIALTASVTATMAGQS